MREIRQPRDLAGLRGSRLERGGGNTESRLRPQRCDTCHPGAGAQGPNRHEYCTQPLPSRRQGHERNLPSLAAEPQLLPGPPGSLVLSANLQVLRGCLPTCTRLSLRGFPGHPSGVATRPSAWCIKQPVLRSFTRARTKGNEHLADWTRIPGTPSGTNIALGWRTHRQGPGPSQRCVGTSLQSGFSGRCDTHGRESSPHAGDRKRTPPPPPSLRHPTPTGDPRAKADWRGPVD